LVIAGEPFQTRYNPIIFNGALSDHYNKPITGQRYSLVYFVSAPSKATDQQIFQLHNNLIKSHNVKGGSLQSIETDKKVILDQQPPEHLCSQFFCEDGRNFT